MGELSRALASHVQDVANWFLIGSLIVGVVSTFFVVWTGNVKESYLKKDVASANAVAEKAKADAANANEKTAELNNRAQEIERDNIKLKVDLENTIIEASSEKQKLAKTQIEVAEAKTHQAEAERALIELKTKIKARILTQVEAKHFIDKLRTGPIKPIGVRIMSNDGESATFGNQILNILESNGWPIGEVSSGVSFGGQPAIGLILFVHDPENIPPHSETLITALREVGYDVKGSTDTRVPEGSITIGIGIKPLLK